MPFQTDYLLNRISDFWNRFDDRYDVSNIWDAYLRKSGALGSLLRQADKSKSLATIPMLDRNSVEYFVFENLIRREDLEQDGAFYVFEVDKEIFYIRELRERINSTPADRSLSSPDFFEVQELDDRASIIRFFRGVEPSGIGETFWSKGSDSVSGTGFEGKVSEGDVVQGQDGGFYKVLSVVSDSELKVQGPKKIGEEIGIGDGVNTSFQLSATEDVIADSVVVLVDGGEVESSGFTADDLGAIEISTPPPVGSVVTADYHQGYVGVTATNRRTVKESIPSKLFSTSVYRNRRAIYSNFGVQIGLDEPVSEVYLNKVRGIYFARWKGPTVYNMDLGAGILGNLPFDRDLLVNAVRDTSPKSVTVDSKIRSVPDALDITVPAGSVLPYDFNLLTDGIEVRDFISNPDFFRLEPLSLDPQKYFTFVVAVKGEYILDISEQTESLVDYGPTVRFARDIKPSYTDFTVATDLRLDGDGFGLFIGAVDALQLYDATQYLSFNYINFTAIPEFLTVNGYADEDAAVAAGNSDMDLDSVGVHEEIEFTDIPTEVIFSEDFDGWLSPAIGPTTFYEDLDNWFYIVGATLISEDLDSWLSYSVGSTTFSESMDSW